MAGPTRRIRVPDDVARLIRGLHPHLKKKIKAAIKMITSNPNEGKELRDDLSELRSFRGGRFRIIYRVRRGALEIVAVGPRDRIYEDTYRILMKEES
jgi:mRNA interferase RelE/StbE